MTDITITHEAASWMANQMRHRGQGLGVRFGVKPSGCSGYQYVLEYVDQPDPEDLVIEQHGIRAFVDPRSMVFLQGMVVEFVRQGLNTGIEFQNPNVAGRCGCGESFSV